MAGSDIRIAVFAGDGIGHEITPPCVELARAACAKAGAPTPVFETLPGGAGTYRDHGEALPEASVAAARAADAILLAAMGLPDVRYPDGTECVPQVDLRDLLDLYAGVRPVRTVPGVPVPLADPRAKSLDFVLIRESTEGLFALRREMKPGADEARDIQVITRKGSDRLFRFSFAYAKKRRARGYPGKLTLVDKANVLSSMAFFREIFDAHAARHPDVTADRAYVDATALNMIRRPWDFDVMVTENMYGDILSDLAAGLMGGLGMAPSADIGDAHAVFQPCHGTAPDIMGQGKANPTAMYLSAALMLDYLGDKFALPSLHEAGSLIERAVDTAFGSGTLTPTEFGGRSGLREITDAVFAALNAAA